MKKLRILIDMDATICDLHSGWLDLINKELDLSLSINDITKWDFHIHLNLPESIYSLLDRPNLFFDAKVIDQADIYMPYIWNKYDCYIVSAASYSNDAVREKWRWLQKHFPFVDKTKVIFAKDKSVINGDYLIDDAIHNIENFPNRTIMYSQPWNLSYKDNKMIRVSSWKEIKEYFDGHHN